MRAGQYVSKDGKEIHVLECVDRFVIYRYPGGRKRLALRYAIAIDLRSGGYRRKP